MSDQSHVPAQIPLLAPGYAGDYIGIASFKGKSYAAWHDNRNGNWQVYVSEVDYDLPSTISSESSLAINEPNTITGSITYQAMQTIAVANISNVSINPPADIEMKSGEEIRLYPGFSVTSGAHYHAWIDNSIIPCSTPGSQTFRHSGTAGAEAKRTEHNISRNFLAFAYPNPASNFITVGCINKYAAKSAIITVSDISGNTILKGSASYIDGKQIRQVLNISSLAPGMYFVTIQTENNVCSIKIIKTK